MNFSWLLASFLFTTPVTRVIDCHGGHYKGSLQIQEDNIIIRRCVVDSPIEIHSNNIQLWRVSVGTLLINGTNIVVADSVINKVTLTPSSARAIIRHNTIDEININSLDNQVIANVITGSRLLSSEQGNLVRSNVYRQ